VHLKQVNHVRDRLLTKPQFRANDLRCGFGIDTWPEPRPGRPRPSQSLRFENGRYSLGGVRVTLDDGIGLAATVDATTLPLLFALDPAQQLRNALAEADVSGTAAVSAMRGLFEQGFLERL
jgi:hypothetical protein